MIDLEQLRKLADEWYSLQKYGEEPYSVHIDEGEAVLSRFGCTRKSHPDLQGGFFLHDVFEDRRDVTTEMVADLFIRNGWANPGDTFMDIPAIRWAWRGSDDPEPGLTRKQRKAKTYPKIAAEPEAIIIKLADRIANCEKAGKLDMYRREHAAFREALYRPGTDAEPMWVRIDQI